jgi:three-Cys-motif partner protein
MVRKKARDHGEPTLFPLSDVQSPSQEAPAPTRPTFFSAQRNASAIKTKIVVDYFGVWANIMKRATRSGKIAYFDFYSGPGTYDDLTESTPLQIMRTILGDEQLRKITLTIFEDKSPDAVHSLSRGLSALEGIASLAHEPSISEGESMRKQVEEVFKTQAIIPTFMFLDPFGYAGLTRELMQAILKDWGCEIVFYFNFNRINGALRNPKVRSHMDKLFGRERVGNAQATLNDAPDEATRERIVLGALREALYDIGAKHVLAYGFRKTTGALGHHLVFATKNSSPAQRIMKDIMSRASSVIDADGVGSFEFNPAHDGSVLLIDQDKPPMMQLCDDLLETFRGQALTVTQVYEHHNETTPFTLKNYQDALRILAYDRRAVTVARGELMPLTRANVSNRHMSDKYTITFPPGGAAIP